MRRASQCHTSIEDYWQNSEIRDTFWQTTFPKFIELLEPVFFEPCFAGAALLSDYIACPYRLKETFTETPERFGRLRAAGLPLDAIFDQIIERSRSECLEHCAKSFIKAQLAARRLESFAKCEPVLYRDLQRKRSALKGKRYSPRQTRTYALNFKF
jgi:hypothetical protein